ncbi:MAG: hypothetical protein FPO08_13365 [Geobacter sp.]|uniref:hypothetical protein n=1 Tax=Geomonas ferrireducens TaxID=2570227 RepID=UPI0010A7831B|nr:hypothetical protein [Geomonas ferrireducens]TSK05817.1 MAG: hypothetical protein FPO08_13365 [Geobacter sp.]
MNRYCQPMKTFLPMLLLLCLVLTAGCARVVFTGDGPPILSEEEVTRPYQKVGTIEVHRTRDFTAEALTPADYNWAYDALRAEAGKIGADAVISPEVKVETETFIIFPRSEMTARGTAIKFR